MCVFAAVSDDVDDELLLSNLGEVVERLEEHESGFEGAREPTVVLITVHFDEREASARKEEDEEKVTYSMPIRRK